MALLIAVATGCAEDLTSELGVGGQAGVIPRLINDRGDIAFEVGGIGWSETYVYSAETKTKRALAVDGRPFVVPEALAPDGTVAGVVMGGSDPGWDAMVWDPQGNATNIVASVRDETRYKGGVHLAGITGAGVVIGTFDYADIRTPHTVAFRWDPTRRTSAVIDLGEEPAVWAMNDAGVIVGESPAGGVRWVPAGAGYLAQRLSGGVPRGINGLGDIVGWSGSGGLGSTPVVWPVGQDIAVPLASPGSLPEGQVHYYSPLSINDGGVVVGNLMVAGDPATSYAYRWDSALTRPDAAPRRLELVGPAEHRMSSAGDINNKGVAVGVSNENWYSNFVPVRWS